MRRIPHILLVVLIVAAGAGMAKAEDSGGRSVRPASYYVNITLGRPTSFDVIWERMRIAKEVGLDQMTRYPEPRPSLQIGGVMDRELYEYQRQDLNNTLRAEIKMTYYEIASLRKQADAVRSGQDVLKETVEIAQRLYAVGKGNQTDVLQSQIQYARLQQDLLLVENRARLAEIRLNTICGLPPGEPVPPVEELADFPFRPTGEELYQAYRLERPILTAIRRTIARGRSMSVEGDLRLLSFLDNEALTLITSGLATMRTREAQIMLYRGTVLPQAEQTLRAATEGYRVGRVSFPDLMGSVRDLLAFRKDYYAMLGDRYMWRAKLESVVGKELDREPAGD